MFNDKLRITLLFGGRSAEHEVSILSARSIYKALNKEKYIIKPIAISKKGYFLSEQNSKEILLSELKEVPEIERENILSHSILDLLENETDLVFPVLHGPYGEDGKIQGFLDTLNIRYLGCDLRSSVVGMDKAVMKKVFAYHNIPQSNFEILKKDEVKKENYKTLFNELTKELKTPLFVKPANMGSSIGISTANDFPSFKRALKEAFKYDQKIIIESYVKAREVESAVLKSGKQIKVSAPGEIIAKHEFYDYQAKYEDQSTELIIPAEISDKKKEKIRELSKKAFKAIDGKGLSRLDFFVNEQNDEVLINEINTMPGFTKFSMYPLLFEEIGISYQELLDILVQQALDKDN